MIPLVSIACITYNHEPYIRQCLDGFIMQQTNFDFEVVIHDDASTDGTNNVIAEYCSRYPQLIRPIYQQKNKYKEGRGIYVRFVFPECRGKYIAMCEGDDYWTDPFKLQKQVDFLETHKTYVLCGHRYHVLSQSMLRSVSSAADMIDGTFNIMDFVTRQVFCSTLTIVFRRSAINYLELNRYQHVIDAVLFYHLLKQGDGYCMNDVMAVYRLHNNGVWSAASHERQMEIDFNSRLSLCRNEKSYEAALFLKILFNKPMSRKFILKHIKLIYQAFCILYKSFGIRVALRQILGKMILI